MNATPVIDIGTVKDAAPLSRTHILIVALCAGVMFFDGLDLLTISFAAPAIGKALGLLPQQVGLMFSAGLVGLGVGGLLQGPFSDRLGRKPMLVACVILFGVGTWLTALATSFPSLMTYRFIAGLGLGAATPVVLTLVTDSCPARLRAPLSMVMYCGLMVGGLFGGLLTALTSGPLGWQGVFEIGGFLPLLYVPVLLWCLPESVEFLTLKGGRDPQVGRTLQRLVPGFEPVAGARYVSAASSTAKGSLMRLFRGELRARTWVTSLGFLCTLMSLYFYASWLPALMRGIGLSEGQSIAITLSGQVGNLVGSLLIARLMMSWPPYKVITVTYVGAALALVAVSLGGPNFALQMGLNFLVGVFLSGSLNGFTSLTPQLYPADLRATGTGWARSVGYIGAVIGPGVAGALMARQWTAEGLFQLAAVPPLLAALTCLVLAVLVVAGPRRGALATATARAPG